MAYGPHTAGERSRMLEALGIASVDALFEAIPPAVRAAGLDLPPALTELELMEHLGDLAGRNRTDLVELPRGRRLPPPPPAGRGPAAPAGRVLHRLHAVPAGDQPGNAADDLRVPVAPRRADRDGRRLGVALRRRGGDRGSRPHDLPGDRPRARPRLAGRPSALPRDVRDLLRRGQPHVRRDPPGRRRSRRRHHRPGRPRADAGRPGAPGRRRRRRAPLGPRPARADGGDRPPRPRRRRPLRRGRRARRPRGPRAARGLRRRHRGRRGPVPGHASPVRRAVPRDRGLSRGPHPPDPRAPHRDDRRPRGEAGVRHDAARARAGHPARAGGQQHLHEPGPVRPRRLDLPRGARARRPPRRRGDGRRAGGGARGRARGRGRAAPPSRPVSQRVRRPRPGRRRRPPAPAGAPASWPASRWPSWSRATRRSPRASWSAPPRSPRPAEIERFAAALAAELAPPPEAVR